MIFRPEQGAMWDPSILWHDGKYYAFMMYNKDGRDGLAAGHCLLATSTDGVHWKDQGPVIDERARPDGATFFKCYVAKCGDKFIMDHGVARPQGQDLMRFYQSKDLRHWEYVTSTEPDDRWYRRDRWDHMYVLPKEEGRPEAGYWGYPVAVPKQGVDLPAMMQSADGIKWEVLPPARTEWGNTPSRNHFEYGGCERIGGKYYLIGGTGGYMGAQGYAMFTLIGDGPCGPFCPDAVAYRLCGNSGRAVTWLAAWVRGKDELLISNYASMRDGDRAPWLLPLRKPVVDEAGHLRLGWWKGNEALKGRRVALKPKNVDLNGEAKPGGYHVLYLHETSSPGKGLILEGKLKARALASLGSAAAKPTAGFVIEEQAGQAMAVQLGIGRPEARETHVGRLITGPGRQPLFSSEDVTGQGCATVTGIEDGKEHTFRLLCRMEMFELYVDDLLVQTYIRQPGSGRVGLLACNAQVGFSDLRAWTMSLPAAAVAAPRGAGKTDKTLVSWVTLANTTQQGGSALTIQLGVAFDAIVFGEKLPGKWMAGSDYLTRTQDRQDANPAEQVDARTLIQVAIVYAGGRISIYRDGAPYASYPANNVDLLTPKDNLAVFGLRHQGAGSGQTFQGTIEDARIYSRALTADQIKQLRPNERGRIKPYAWWTFETGKETDRMGRFPCNSLGGGARIEGGRLRLESKGATLLATAQPIPAPANTAVPPPNR